MVYCFDYLPIFFLVYDAGIYGLIRRNCLLVEETKVPTCRNSCSFVLFSVVLLLACYCTSSDFWFVICHTPTPSSWLSDCVLLLLAHFCFVSSAILGCWQICVHNLNLVRNQNTGSKLQLNTGSKLQLLIAIKLP